MFIKFDEEAQKVLKNAKIEMKKLHHPFIGSEHVILSILKSKSIITEKLNEYGISYDLFKKELIKTVGIGSSINNYYIYTPLLKRILENAMIDARESHMNVISVYQLFMSILDEGEGVGIRILNNLGLNIDDLYENLNTKSINKKGYKKLLISESGINLNKQVEDGNIDPLIGRDKEVNELIEILLRRNKNNPLLIGEAGVGKTAIVEELAKRIVFGMVPDKLKKYKIYSLSMASCVAGTKYRGEFEDKITKLLNELENSDDIIVFIDEIHTIVGAGGAEGAIDASNIIKPALARGKIKVIGATTINEYKETICKDKALNRRFQTIMIRENTLEETRNILYNLKGIYEEYHNVTISNDVINTIVYLSDKYIGDRTNPDKSIDILDIVCTKVSLNKDNQSKKLDELNKKLKEIKTNKNKLIMEQHYEKAFSIKDSEMKLESKINVLNSSVKNKKRKIITIYDVADVIEEKTQIPVYEIKNDTHKVEKMMSFLNNKVIGQETVIQQVVDVTKKIMLGLHNNLPYSFLLVGKSGVGKTLLVKEYSNYLNIPLIKLDMSEYKEPHTISKIIGSPPGYIGYDDTSNVLEKVKNHPFSIILLDEIEKACSEVINLFLQILDDGIITDSHGNKTNFKNTIIFMTSNLGSNKENIGFNKDNSSNDEIKNILTIPLMNRINTVCTFNSITKDNLKIILKNQIKNNQKLYEKQNIKISISKKQLEEIINKSKYDIYGARHAIKKLNSKMDELAINNILINN